MSKPLEILDLYCGAGGISRGIAQAAAAECVDIRITGVDLYPQRNYPRACSYLCEHEFIQTDAIPFLIEALRDGRFDYIHASPPCKRYTKLAILATQSNQNDRQLEAVRDILRAQEIPYQIENVANTPIRADVILTGEMFGLKTIRTRWFELGGWWFMPNCLPTLNGSQSGGQYLNVAGKGGYRKNWEEMAQKTRLALQSRPPLWTTGSAVADRKIALGIDWMTSAEMAQAIPPAYSKYIFTQYLRQR